MAKTKRRADPGSVAIYPGSFDPLTHGHLDVIKRGARIFPHFIVAILKNPEKKALFSLAERMRLLRDVVKDLPGIEVDSFSGLLVDYARARDATVLVRGLRAVSDFEYEFQMALMNRRLDEAIETVFMMPREDYSYVSSRLVKEVASLGGDVSGLVSPVVHRALMAKLRGGRRGR
ncbi:MAG: pantetheine-phosphate adenylyltransferase [Planctomycetota bacterium]